MSVSRMHVLELNSWRHGNNTGPLGKWLNHEGPTLTNGISVLIRENKESVSTLFTSSSKVCQADSQD